MRARIKSREEMPARFMCCPETVKAMTPFFGREVEVFPPIVEKVQPCPYCGSTSSIGPAYRCGNTNLGLPIDTIDIDEGVR